jgi:hypothetical protein
MKQVIHPYTMIKYATIEVLFQTIFSMLYDHKQCNTNLVLRVVRGDGKGIQCPGVYLGHPVLGGYKYGDLALQVGGSLKNWDNKIWS